MSDRQGGMVATQASEAAIRKSLTVDVDHERAFTVFTEGFDSWWDRSHHIGAAELDVAIIEQRQGGRWSDCGWPGLLRLFAEQTRASA
jgi:hypothetical protein